MHYTDPQYSQYSKAAEYASQAAANLSDPSTERSCVGTSYLDLLGMQDAYLAGLLQQQKQNRAPILSKSRPTSPGPASPGYYGNPAFGLNMSYPGSAERNLRFHPGLSNLTGSIMGSWSPVLCHMDEGFPSIVLEEFKSSKTRCLKLSDIAGHVVEFSGDQYGSRFIQQKLEMATTKEKDMVFEEVMPQALSLVTDVFGNYVTQKFFEHGSASQIRKLADKLNGHVLALSLQMYGCRVIQKHVLQHGKPHIKQLAGQIVQMNQQKFASNVVQKCMSLYEPAKVCIKSSPMKTNRFRKFWRPVMISNAS